MAKPCTCTATPKITFRLEKWERAVVFQVISCDERFNEGESFDATNDMEVRRDFGMTMLTNDSIDLGDEKEFEPVTLSFESNAKRDTYYARVLEALKDWAQNWESFDGPDTSARAEGQPSSIFTF